MSDPAVLIAVRAKMAGLSGLPPISWPNDDGLPSIPPFLIFDTGPMLGTPITIDGEERFEFRPQVSYMAKQGTYTASSDAALWAIAQAFSYGTRISDDGEYVAQCLQTPTADNGYPDGAFYRRNMTLRIASDQQI